jgi:N-acetylglucosaminyl-diphospho-decaprenol L-rhamnosyltransferase
MLYIVIVTHNSEKVIDKAMVHLFEQEYTNFKVIIIDSGSDNTDYIEKYRKSDKCKIILKNVNIGFCKANNLAISKVIDKSSLLLLHNPDLFLSRNFIKDAVDIMDADKEEKIGILTGKLLRFDISNNERTDIIDSTGIFQKWYGKWYDRGQGMEDYRQYDNKNGNESIPAVCGALMLCRASALKTIRLSQNEYFNNSFFMYKDDIDLSLRVKKIGYGLKYNSNLIAWHCRGWQSRNKMSKRAKYYSARNEYEINKNRGWIKSAYSKAKLILANLDI